jgi:hypothetical protein
MNPNRGFLPPCHGPARRLSDRLVAFSSRAWLAIAATASLLLSLAACSTSVPDPASSDAAADAAASDVGSPDDTAMASLVWAADATKMVVEDHGGGLIAPAPTGSACPAVGVGTYTLTVADKGLAWHICTSGALYTYVDGMRTLNDADYASLITALKGVALSTSTSCGADKSVETLTVTTPSAETTYLDSFYVCAHQGIYVDGIDGVFFAASTLAK